MTHGCQKNAIQPGHSSAIGQYLFALAALTLTASLFAGCAAPVKLTGYPGPAAQRVSSEYCENGGFQDVAVLGLSPAPDTFDEVGYMAINQSSDSEFYYSSLEKQIDEARIRACQWGADAIVILGSEGDKNNYVGFLSGLQYRDERNTQIVAIRYKAAGAEIAEIPLEAPPLPGPPAAPRPSARPQSFDTIPIRSTPWRRSAWVSVSGRYGTYKMEDLNNEIETIDNLVRPAFNPIDDGPGVAAQLGFMVSRSVGLSLNYERMSASSSVSDGSGRLTYDVPANALWLGVESFVPTDSGDLELALGVGAVSCDGNISFADYTEGTS
ncbi:MAG: hypothetical protein R3E12_18520, partial [Candidatus Eisenbacteria bacterium]